MHKLPLEVLSSILTYLEFDDYMSLRFVNHQTSRVAAPFLFHRIFVYNDSYSFEQLEAIANHEHIRGYVREIVYDPRMATKYLDQDAWRIDIESQSGEKLESYGDPDVEFRRYNDYVTKQSILSAEMVDVDRFRKTFPKFPSVRSLHLYTGRSQHFRLKEHDFVYHKEPYGPVLPPPSADGTVSHGWKYVRNPCAAFFVPAVDEIPEIIELKLEDAWLQVFTVSIEMQRELKTVRHLSLDLLCQSAQSLGDSEINYHQTEDLAPFGKFISSNQKLETFNLSCEHLHDDLSLGARVFTPTENAPVELGIPRVLATCSMAFRHLRHLRLSHFALEANTLEKMLEFNNDSLKSLVLEDICLTEGSCTPFLHNLPKLFRRPLQHFSLIGTLHGKYAHWDDYSESSTINDPPEPTTMRRRIETWIQIGGIGDFPLWPKYPGGCPHHSNPGVHVAEQLWRESEIRCMSGDQSFVMSVSEHARERFALGGDDDSCTRACAYYIAYRSR